MRRLQLAALLLVACVAALPVGAPRAGADQGFQAATNLRVKEVRHVGNPGLFIVDLLWDGPAKPDCPGGLLVGAAVEVRDVDQNGQFHFVQTHGDVPALFAPNYAQGGFSNDGDSPLHFLREGGVYEVRLSYRWQAFRNPPTVPQDVDVTTYSPLLQVTIATEEPVDPKAPTDVVAIADAKKPRVSITWKSTEPQGTRYVVERRQVSGTVAKASGPKAAETDFTEIASVEALKFLDRSVDPDSEYEYRIATVVDQVLARSARDTVFTAGKCPSSAFQIWPGYWMVGLDSIDHRERLVFDTVESQAEVVFLDDTRNVIQSHGPLRLLSRPTFSIPVELLDDMTFDGQALPLGTRGTLRSVMRRKVSPFSDDWQTAEFTLTFLHDKERLERTTSGRRLLFDRVVGTTVCAAIGHSLGTRSVAPGTSVAFAFQVVALGPGPLLPEELRLDCTAEGGTFEQVLEMERTREVSVDPFVPGGTKALFEVGSLGPVKPTKSEVARIVLVAKADGTRAKLRCRVRFLDSDGGQSLRFAQLERYCDVAVGPPAAK